MLALGIGLYFYARHHREQVSRQFAHVLAEEARTPEDVKKIKDELAAMNLTKSQLDKELEGRLKMAAALKSEDFYLSIDTRARKLRFYYGGTVLRESDVQIGESRTITGNGRSWTFIPLKGAFPVEAKIVDYAWPVPEWVYAMNGQPAPQSPQTIEGGLGKFVVFLPNGYVIHTQPVESSPLKGAKPGSIMVGDDTLRAIWPRIHKGTQVYIF
ncbi:MAG TPA: L,D-transpeptidase [Thermoanaerobaculia bacterium]